MVNSRIIKALGNVLKMLAIFIIAASSMSCSMFAKHGIPLTSSQIFESVQSFIDSTGTRTVVLFPMWHVAKSSEYARIADYLDTLKAHGYVTFCEGVLATDKYSDSLSISSVSELRAICSPNDSVRLDTLRRKMRKILGQNLGSMHDEMAFRHGMVVQTIDMLRLTGDRDYWVDMTYADVIQEFEEKFGEIVLSQYDYECPLDSQEYKGKMDGRFSYLRSGHNKCNDKLARWILDSSFDKIAVVYGYAHIHYLQWSVLQKNGYKPVTNR